jgi:hypothetical protein
MKRTCKLRGNSKRFSAVENWVQRNKELDFEYLQENKRDYCKIRVTPWGTRISITNSSYPEPSGQIKIKIIEGLLKIYDSWKEQLDKLGKPYYLKVWLYDPNVSQSQVVCAIDDCIDYYEKTFHKSENTKQLDCDKFGSLKDRIDKYNWERYLDEDVVFESEYNEVLDSEYLSYFNKMKNKSQRKEELNFEYKEGVKDVAHFVTIGDVWLGSR